MSCSSSGNRGYFWSFLKVVVSCEEERAILQDGLKTIPRRYPYPQLLLENCAYFRWSIRHEKVASHFYTFENNVTHSRNAMFGTAFEIVQEQKILKAVHLETLEASAFRSIVHWKHFQKLKPKAVFH